jgi:branched-chain amino acid transport system ATP-binding protein
MHREGDGRHVSVLDALQLPPPGGPVPDRSPALLEVRDVSVVFGGLRALEAVSLEVAPGQVLGLIGPNGAGKTTLFNVVCGFVRPTSGAVAWEGRALRRHAPKRLAGMGIARTLQGLGLFPGLTVLENVMVGAGPHARAGFASALLGLPRSDGDERRLRERALAQLQRLGVAADAGRLASALPYGVQKQVALARALVAEPRLLLLDEPASGLSAEEMRQLADQIRGLADEMAVMLVEHHMDLVMTVCDAITVLDFGKVIAHGTPEQVRSAPAVVEAYLGAQVDGQVAGA